MPKKTILNHLVLKALQEYDSPVISFIAIAEEAQNNGEGPWNE